MRRHLATTAILTGILAGSLAGTAGVAAAAPADTCNAYSSTCPSPEVSGLHLSRNPQTGPQTGPQVEGTSQSQLPFTGGEIAGMALLGVGAVGAGVIFVTSGRRRRSASH
jgi:hypothetical protein